VVENPVEAVLGESRVACFGTDAVIVVRPWPGDRQSPSSQAYSLLLRH
jgi:hypothetical protein